MKILLRVLFLSGYVLMSTCLLHQYHYVADLKNWTEAQSYCRKKYIDLATIKSTEELNLVANSLVWTGSYSKENRNKELPYGAYRSSLGSNLVNPWSLSNNNWYYDNCSAKYPFICYNGTQLDPQFVLVNKTMNLSSALSYCRKNFIDLVKVRNWSENQNVQNLVPNGNRVWIGLKGSFKMSWSNGSISKGYFYPNTPVACGLIDSSKKLFIFYDCYRRFPFICYSIISTPRAVRRQVVKLKMKVEDQSMNLNDPDVKADMIKKDRLQEKGVSGVNLKWREQPDGKVFHKEEKTDVTHDER